MPVTNHKKYIFLLCMSMIGLFFALLPDQTPQIAATTNNNSVDRVIWTGVAGNPPQAVILSNTIQQTPLNNGTIIDIAVSPFNAEDAYYLTSGNAIWKTDDGGLTFAQTTVISVPSGGYIADIAVSATDQNHVFALVDTGLASDCNDVFLYESVNGGSSWLPSQVVDTASNGLPLCIRSVSKISIKPTDANTVYVTGSGRGELLSGGGYDAVIYKRNSDGVWDLVHGHDGLANNTGFSFIRDIDVTTFSEQWVVALGSTVGNFPSYQSFLHGVLVGKDDNWTYKPIEGCDGCFGSTQQVDIVDVAVSGNTIIALVEGHGIYRSNDLGNTWVQDLAIGAVGHTWKVEPSPFHTGQFWLTGYNVDGIDEHGVFRSGICGGGWTRYYSFVTAPTGLAISLNQGEPSDEDGDGLWDTWETYGYDHDGDCQIDVDLPAMGADPQHKDVFVEADYMLGFDCTGSEPCRWVSIQIDDWAIERVVNAFANAPVVNPDESTGITLHVDNGANSTMNPITGEVWGDLSQNNPISFRERIAVPGDPEFNRIFEAHMPLARRPIFHYVLAANLIGNSSPDLVKLLFPEETCRANVLGQAEPSNNTFVMYLGQSVHNSSHRQAVTFMHELGHNLGLSHGGSEANVNNEPNYISIMNYGFARRGGLIKYGLPSHLDYSRAELGVLDESALDESAGLTLISSSDPNYDPSIYGTYYYKFDDSVRPCLQPYFAVTTTSASTPSISSPIDWDNSGHISTSIIQEDINGSPDCELSRNLAGVGCYGFRRPTQPSFGILTGYDDWANLRYNNGTIGSLAQPAIQTDDIIIEPTAEEILFQPYEVQIATSNNMLVMNAGDSSVISVTVQNVGGVITDLDFTAQQNSWFTHTLPNQLQIGENEILTYPITVQVPLTATLGSQNEYRLTFTPQQNHFLRTDLEIKVQIGAIALFDSDVYEGVTPLKVEFTNLSSNNVISQVWQFGDGIISYDLHPTHTYTIAGSYQPTLTIYEANGSYTYKGALITVQDPLPVYDVPFFVDVITPTWSVNGWWHPIRMSDVNSVTKPIWTGILKDSILQMNVEIDLTKAVTPTLTYLTQFPNGIGTGYVLVSTNNGLNWQTAYTQTTSIHEWTQQTISLNQFSGQKIQLAFYLADITDPWQNGHLGWSIDNVRIEASGSNTPPIAYDDWLTVTAPITSSLIIPPLANDVDPDGTDLTIEFISYPIHGSLTQIDQTFIYTPTNGFIGIDQFHYRVTDEYGGRDEAVVSINIIAPAFTPNLSIAESVNVILNWTESGDECVYSVENSNSPTQGFTVIALNIAETTHTLPPPPEASKFFRVIANCENHSPLLSNHVGRFEFTIIKGE